MGLFSNAGSSGQSGVVLDSRIEGVESAVKALHGMGEKVAKRAIKKAVRAGGAVFVKAAKRNAPTDKKHLKKSIRQKVKFYPVSGATVSIVGARNRKFADGSNPAKYSHLVESGTRPHEIKPKRGQVLNVKGQMFRTVQHPGAKASRFLQQARNANIRESVAAFRFKIEVEVEREALAASLLRGPSSSAVKEVEAFF